MTKVFRQLMQPLLMIFHYFIYLFSIFYFIFVYFIICVALFWMTNMILLNETSLFQICTERVLPFFTADLLQLLFSGGVSLLFHFKTLHKLFYWLQRSDLFRVQLSLFFFFKKIKKKILCSVFGVTGMFCKAS